MLGNGQVLDERGLPDAKDGISTLLGQGDLIRNFRVAGLRVMPDAKLMLVTSASLRHPCLIECEPIPYTFMRVMEQSIKTETVLRSSLKVAAVLTDELCLAISDVHVSECEFNGHFAELDTWAFCAFVLDSLAIRVDHLVLIADFDIMPPLAKGKRGVSLLAEDDSDDLEREREREHPRRT